ncbi:MAG: hypothetical protein KGK30_09220, partial [Elusimicrobia bacterium]|nr:hypothetical protein [Elusimicrobiota bacterium]
NPAGAPGGPVDLSMDSGPYGKRASETTISSLYQAPKSDEKAGKAPSTLAAALAAVAARAPKPAASARRPDWGRPAASDFNPPKASFGSMSGLPSDSSAGGASYSNSSDGGGGVVSGFAASSPNTGVEYARGLHDEGASAGDGKGVMGALDQARRQSVTAARQRSNDAATAMSGAAFDGSGGGGSIGGGGGAAGGAGLYAGLDSAPINLKANDPNLSRVEIEPPPKPTPMPQAPDPNDQMRQMVMQMVMMMVVGGVMGGLQL